MYWLQGFLTGRREYEVPFSSNRFTSVVILGCANNDQRGLASAPYIGEGNQEFESLYHYGYYRGCKNAYVTKQQQTELYGSVVKDTALDGLDKFDNGWEAGLKACEDGVARSMYNLTASQ